MTEEKKEEEKNIKMVVMKIACEVEAVNGDEEHVWALPLHRRYMVPKVEKEEKIEIMKDIRVRESMWLLLGNIGNEVKNLTKRRPSMDEILFANRFTITPEAVLELRQREAERRRGKPVGEGEKKKRKSLLDVAIEERKERKKEEEMK